MTELDMKAIVAVSLNGVIGKEGSIPWFVKGDLRRFKERTWGGVLLMGRKTYDSIGRPLPGRETVVLSRSLDFIEGGVVIGDLSELASLDICKGKTIWVSGGEAIYRMALPYCNELYLTRIQQTITDGDTFFPKEYEASFKFDQILEKTDEFEIERYTNSNPKTLKHENISKRTMV